MRLSREEKILKILKRSFHRCEAAFLGLIQLLHLTITYKYIIFTRNILNMDKKLTLSLNQNIIEKAKKYAKKNNTSLSKMIEAYFNSLTSKENSKDEFQISPLVESLCGVIKLPEDFDYKKSKAAHLQRKYK